MRLTVRQNLTVYAGLYGVANVSPRIAHLAEELQLEELLDRPTGKLSAGQKTRVGLAKALLNAPELLLLDEPTASLDPDTADWIRHKLKDYAQAAAPPCCLPRIIWQRSSASPIASFFSTAAASSRTARRKS